MKIPFLDLSVKDPEFRLELVNAVDRVLEHGRILLGPEHELFEKKIAEFCGKKYAVGVNSGTDALYLTLRSLDIGPGDEVITTPLSWIATFNAISLCGAAPVCIDLKDDLTIDPGLIQQANNYLRSFFEILPNCGYEELLLLYHKSDNLRLWGTPYHYVSFIKQ